MAMLAEPRRKKRSINLRVKNNWSDDPDKFGSKMMQKMGWTPGKGLGLNEDGAVDNVKVRFKDDNGGVGFTDKNDQWTQHEASFEELLRNLHGGTIDKTKLHSESSLEEKSKNLQSRLHYKKFTRGKDITKYSTKDLANIFGKKTLTQEKPKEAKPEQPKEVEEESNLNLVAGGCMKDYFNSKLKNKFAVVPDGVENYESIDLSGEDDCEVAFRGFSCGTSSIENTSGIVTSTTELSTCKFLSFNKVTEPDSNGCDDNLINKKKKKKKKQCIDMEGLPFVNEEVSGTVITEQVLEIDDLNVTEGSNKKKSKKNKKIVVESKENNLETISITETAVDSIEITKKKKNKKKKMSEEDNSDNTHKKVINISDDEYADNDVIFVDVSRKKKKNKMVVNGERDQENHKHKKRKEDSLTTPSQESFERSSEVTNTLDQSDIPKKKKKLNKNC